MLLRLPELPDAYDMWVEHDREQNRQLESLPKCFHCGEPVQQDMAVYLEGFGYLCDDCIKNNMTEVNDYGY